MSISNTGINIYYYKDTKEQQTIPLFSDPNNNLDKNLKKRSFYSNDNKDKDINDNLEKEILRFDNNVHCNVCGKKIDIAKLTVCYDKMDKFEKLTCYMCKNQIEPRIRVRLGDTFITISLYQPYFLYNNLSSNLINIYGNQLDLDELREKYCGFLYNCCWYFNLKGISYDMMLKYKKEKDNINDKIAQNKKKRKSKFVSLEIEKTND